MKNKERIESFIDFLCSSSRYGTFTESSRTDPLHLSHDTWRELTKKSISDYQRDLFRKVIERYRQPPPPSRLDVSHHVFCGVR